jgi:hypothetical protein
MNSIASKAITRQFHFESLQSQQITRTGCRCSVTTPKTGLLLQVASVASGTLPSACCCTVQHWATHQSRSVMLSTGVHIRVDTHSIEVPGSMLMAPSEPVAYAALARAALLPVAGWPHSHWLMHTTVSPWSSCSWTQLIEAFEQHAEDEQRAGSRSPLHCVTLSVAFPTATPFGSGCNSLASPSHTQSL